MSDSMMKKVATALMNAGPAPSAVPLGCTLAETTPACVTASGTRTQTNAPAADTDVDEEEED
jgi:hypothetical protein